MRVCLPFAYEGKGSGENWSATTSHRPASFTRKNMSLPFIVTGLPAIVNEMMKRYVTTALDPEAWNRMRRSYSFHA